MNSLTDLRERAGKGIILLLWVNLALIVARAVWGTEASLVVLVGGGLVVTLAATASWLADRTGPTTRTVTGLAHGVLVALLVYGFSGSSLQIDMHMYFFATLAICAAWVDWRPIASFSAFTAVHHLLLYALLPAAVFTGEATFTRVLLHAIILVLEAGVLLALTYTLLKAFAASDTAVSQAIAAEREAQLMTATASDAHARNDAMRAEREAEAEAVTLALKGFVGDIEAGFDRLSGGDLTVRLERPVAADYESIRALFNDAVGKLELALGSVVGSVAAIRTGLSEISAASHDLAQRTEQQATSLEQTVAALGEVTGGVRQTADSADHARQLATTARTSAERGGAIVGQAIDAMGRIEQSSNRIGTIISVIDEIAFQTNLLALNAGVEAARAGDAGRGFAVVAQEVRGLAQRSAEAAKEIKALISASHDEVGQGVELVTASGRSLEEILGHLGEMATRVSAIADSAREQATSLREVSGAAEQMNKVTQQNAAMVEQTTAASQALAAETDLLSGLVDRFRISPDAGGGSAHQPVSRSRAGAPRRPAAPVVRLKTGGGAAAVAPANDGWQDF
ncbi:methyl-accepting chemotaxis protein [Aurantimonas sp. HBX-1]|uniref:methyl-accepting chemotaxis protein n=1 Tax=Aurantimonas sp. HBX-1 TaxID=2906072 RepID=UPI001F24AF3E|nr:methyl-accepting chemotaxis protein [Aurantimonas sp. HBX-1]UIJ73121.1 methyl-accepting chemotaxis protein [Aurantimonas sp. HBX-1]